MELPVLVYCTEGDVRLEDGEVSSEGRVEICHLEWWQTICDIGWGDLESTVVCRQLGYSRHSEL